jgi:hypothetical protein
MARTLLYVTMATCVTYAPSVFTLIKEAEWQLGQTKTFYR